MTLLIIITVIAVVIVAGVLVYVWFEMRKNGKQ